MAQLFKPRFLDQQDQGSGMYKPLFNFRRLWQQSIAAMLTMALLPLLALAVTGFLGQLTINEAFRSGQASAVNGLTLTWPRRPGCAASPAAS